MKNPIIILIALMCSTIMFQSCSDSDSQNSDSYFQAQIDGLDYQATGDFQAYASNFSNSTNIYGVLDITTASNESMYIQLPTNFTEGNYKFSDDIFAYYTVGEKTWSSKLGTGSGSITIENYDGINISGTFDYTAYDFDDISSGISVTNGRFNVIQR